MEVFEKYKEWVIPEVEKYLVEKEQNEPASKQSRKDNEDDFTTVKKSIQQLLIHPSYHPSQLRIHLTHYHHCRQNSINHH